MKKRNPYILVFKQFKNETIPFKEYLFYKNFNKIYGADGLIDVWKPKNK